MIFYRNTAGEEVRLDEPPFSVREGNIIRDGYNEEVDRLRHILKNGKGVMAEMEAKEKEKTGIKNLRVGYTRVFGYYIEVAKGQVGQVPDSYIRKQTLVSGERFITPELKELENTILTAKDRITSLEFELFTQVRQTLADAQQIERQADGQAVIEEAEQEVLESIGDPAERQKLKEILKN